MRCNPSYLQSHSSTKTHLMWSHSSISGHHSGQWIRVPRLVAIGRYRHRHQAARPPLAEGILPPHLLDSRLQGYELQPYFRITDCSASLSRLRSATKLSQLCVFIAQLLRFLRLAHIHAAVLCFPGLDRVLLYPTSRATSSAFRPASSSFSAPIICASVCLLFDIPSSLSFAQIILRFVRKLGSRSLESLSRAVVGYRRPFSVVRICVRCSALDAVN